MNDKMKTRRRVGLMLQTTSQTSSLLADRRRDFFKFLLEQIQDLPDQDRLPTNVQDEIKKYTRTQNSEQALLRLSEYPVSVVRTMVSALLQNLDGNLASLLQDLLKEIRLTDETMKYMSYDHQLKLKLKNYLRENPQVSIQQLQKDLEAFFPKGVGNVWEPLFHSFLKEETIRNFLATCDFIKPNGDVSIRYFVSQLIDDHRFDLIQELFETGFQPTSSKDWQDALPVEYYQKFPSTLWQLKEWEQFRPFVELSKRYSLDIGDFIRYSFYKDHERLIRLGHEIREKTPPLISPPTPHYIAFYPEGEAELLQRVRPWVDGLVSVLLKPSKNSDIYLGRPYGKYYFPSETFFKDLVSPDVRCAQERTLFSMKHTNITQETELYVFHLLQDGQILPQTRTVYEKGVQYMTQRPRIRIPKIEDYFLSLPYENLSQVDQKIICDRIRTNLSFLLPTVFDGQLDFDAMSSFLLSSVLSKHQDKSLRVFLTHVFQLFFLLNPLYNLDLLSNVIRDRLNLFFYRLDNLDELPTGFYYPQYHFLGHEKQQTFERWRTRCLDNFITESMYSLFTRNYPVLQVKFPALHSISVPKTILLGVETGDKLSLLHPYKDQYISLPDVAESILWDHEYIVNKEPLPVDTLSALEKFFDLERLWAGRSSQMMENDYKITTPLPDATTITTITTEKETIGLTDTLPDFKKNAYEFLGSL